MLHFFRKVRGSVSLILILIMLPMMTYATMIVDGTRVMSAKTAVSGAGDLTMNTALSTYDAALKDAYGLFAMCDNLNDLETTFSAYFSNTMAGTLTELGVAENDPTRDYINQMTDTVTRQILGGDSVNPDELVNHLAMDVSDLQVTGNSSSTLGNPAVMKRQIVEYMKYKAPIMFAADIMDKLEMFKGTEQQTEAIGAQIDYTKSCDSLQEACENAKNSIYAYNDAVIQLDSIAGKNAASYFDARVGNAGSTDTVYADLQSATENLIYFKNLYTFWDTSQNVHIADIDTTTKSGIETALKDLSYYKLKANTSTETYDYSFIKRETQTESMDSAMSSFIGMMNEEITNPEDPAQVIHLWESSYNSQKLENTIALKANFDELEGMVENNKSAFQEVYTELIEVQNKTDSVEFITAYYNFLQKHSFDELGKLCGIHQTWYNYGEDYFKALGDCLTIINSNNEWKANTSTDSLGKISISGVDTNSFSFAQWQKYKLVCAYIYLLEEICGCTLVTKTDGIIDVSEIKNKDTYENLTSSFSPDLRGMLQSVINACASKRDVYLNTAKTQFGNANNKISEYVGQLKTVKEKIGTVCTDMDNVLKYAKEVHTSLDKWDGEIKKTPDGGTKNTMQATHDAEENKIVLDEVEALKTFAYNQKKAYEDYFNYIDSITYFGEKAVSSGQLNAETFVANSVTGGKWRTESTYNTATQIDLTKSKDASGMASDCMKNYFQQNGKEVTGTPGDMKNAVQRNGGAYFIQFGFVQVALNTTSTNGVTRDSNYIYNTYFGGNADQNAKTFYEKLINITTKLQNNDETKKTQYKDELQGKSTNNSTLTDDQKEANEKTNTKADNVSTASSIEGRKPGNTESNELSAPAAFKDITGIDNGESAPEGSGSASDAQKIGGNTSGSIDEIKGDEDKDGDNKTKAENQKNTLKSAGDFMTKIVNLANEAISKAYVEEYFTNMFSCYTTDLENGKVSDKKETSLEGNILASNHHYLYEQEYIIWGGDVGGAVGKTMGVIYGIRFVFNTIYAFTSAEVQEIALNIATAIAGWTVFGIPIVQAIVTVILSLAESGIDLWKLSQGYDVPIMKSRETWSCSISGILNNVTNAAIDKSAELLKGIAEEQLENATQSLTNFVEGQVDSAMESLKNALNASISSAILDLYAKTGLDEMLNNVDEMNKSIKSSIEHVEAIIDESDAPDVIKNAEKQALAEMGIDSIVNTVSGKITSVTEPLNAKNVVTEIQKRVGDAIDSKITDPLKANIKTVIENGSKELSQAVENGVDKATGKLKEGAKDKINDAMEKYMKPSKKSGSSVTEADPKSKGKGLTLNYKQYVKIFTLVGLMTNEDAMLQRCAALIQVNMNQNADLQTTGKKEYHLGTAYTLVEIDATVELNTIFSYEANVNGQTEAEDDGLYSGLSTLWNNPGKSQLHYHSVMGY